jgi:hypothetical protein
MDKRELYKNFEFDGRKWSIGKFDAMTGSYIAYKLMGEMLPAFISVPGIPTAPQGSPVMSKPDFIDMQKDCLRVCTELLPAGPAKVINDNGSWGVEGIENNAKLAITLTVQALVWNLTDFFDESLLQELATGISGLNLPTAKM